MPGLVQYAVIGLSKTHGDAAWCERPNREATMALRLISSVDLAIAEAIVSGTLALVVRESSYGLGEFYSLEDAHGVITVASSHEEALAIIKDIEEKLP